MIWSAFLLTNPSTMNRLRTRWSLRVLAATMLLSLLPASAAAVLHAPRPASSYADWVRAQLREVPDGAVAEALEAAEAQRLRSLDAFLNAFVAAYAAERPGVPAAQLFALDLAPEALVDHLKSRYRGFSAEALPPRPVLVRAVQAVLAPDGSSGAAFLPRTDLVQQRVVVLARQAAQAALVRPLRVVSAAQPLGP